MSILHFINGHNDDHNYFEEAALYICDYAKTLQGRDISTVGSPPSMAVDSVMANKKLHSKTGGKQGEHFVISFFPDRPEVENSAILDLVDAFILEAFPGHIAVTALHSDSKNRHTHTLLDSVNAIDGKKFSQSRKDLNRVKQILNNKLSKDGWSIITDSANDFVDTHDYSDHEGFDFFELDENKIINDNKSLSLNNSSSTKETKTETITSNNHCWTTLDYERNDYNMNNNYTTKGLSTTGMKLLNTSKKDSSDDNSGGSTPMSAEVISPTMKIEFTNEYPNIGMIVGPEINIKGNSLSDMKGLKGIMENTFSKTLNAVPRAADMALYLEKKSQDNGTPVNIFISTRPVFNIDLTERQEMSIPQPPVNYPMYNQGYPYGYPDSSMNNYQGYNMGYSQPSLPWYPGDFNKYKY